MTDAGQAAVERHRDALAAYGDHPAQWRAAYPAMVSAIIAAYARRQCPTAGPDPGGNCGRRA